MWPARTKGFLAVLVLLLRSAAAESDAANPAGCALRAELDERAQVGLEIGHKAARAAEAEEPMAARAGSAAARGLHLFDGHRCKRIHFVRHAEALHNRVARDEPTKYREMHQTELFRDTELTDEGRAQAARLGQHLALARVAERVELVVSSPLRRALSTATIAFQTEPGAGPPILALELARERIALHACDWRSDKSQLVAAFPHVDFAHISTEQDEMWSVKETHPDQYNSTACMARAIDLLAFLMARPETEIAVVSHWVFLKHLFRNFGREIKFANAEAVPMHVCSNEGLTEVVAAAGGSASADVEKELLY